MNKAITTFLSDNSSAMKMWRTIVQGIIGVLIANLDLIIGILVIDPQLKPMIVALSMAILSPIMSELGRHRQEGEIDAEV